MTHWPGAFQHPSRLCLKSRRFPLSRTPMGWTGAWAGFATVLSDVRKGKEVEAKQQEGEGWKDEMTLFGVLLVSHPWQCSRESGLTYAQT